MSEWQIKVSRDTIAKSTVGILSARPSRDYWDGIEAGERSKAEKFLKQIKKCTEKMRYGTGDRDICLNVTPLEYNEAFLPHWKEYANALEQYHYHLNYSTEQRDNVSKLCLLGIELPPDVVYMLSNALESTRFKHFVLKNNNFGQDGIDFALKYLKTNIVMEEFTLINNTINNMDDINKLCEIVKDHPSVDMLQLLRCKGADINGYIMLKTIMNAGKNKLEVVDLCNNNISTGGSTFIQDFLATNPKKLESLYLEGNELDDQDAIGIVEALKQNTHLRFLRLTNNNITKTGWEALRKVEFGDTSLNAAADSNHTCVTKYPPEGSDVIEGLDISEMNGDRDCENAYPPPYARQKKIYSILSSRNRDRSNVKNFDNIPVELLPNILHSIQKYSNYHVENEDISQVRGHVQPLSIVHEICRHWDESLAAFEALSS